MLQHRSILSFLCHRKEWHTYCRATIYLHEYHYNKDQLEYDHTFQEKCSLMSLFFQKLIDVSYDFKLYQKFDDVSLRSFCTNNNAAYVAVEETYGDVTYNGHAKKDPKYLNGMTNFGIIMEIKDIDNPFEWSRKVVNELQFAGTVYIIVLLVKHQQHQKVKKLVLFKLIV